MNKKIPIGLVGLGLMGSSIATCLLAAGHSVTALIRDRGKEGTSKKYMLDFQIQLFYILKKFRLQGTGLSGGMMFYRKIHLI